jgi:HNH endonuclease
MNKIKCVKGVPFEDRFWSKVSKQENGCWDWLGKPGCNGYGYISQHSKRRCAHVAAYEYLVGIIPRGYELHHTCYNRLCVNPVHLIAMSKMEHIRLHASERVPWLRTKCPAGHLLNGDNNCIQCEENARRYRDELEKIKKEGRRGSIFQVLELNGVRKTVEEWSQFTGLDMGTIKSRLEYKGWSTEQVLTKPALSLSESGKRRAAGNRSIDGKFA